MIAIVHTQDVSVSPFTLSHTDQIPFFFCAIPHHLIDDDVFPQLKGNHIKLLLVIDRYRNLKLKQKKFDQQLLSGWTIPVSQQVLADRCGVKRPTINNLVEELIGLGLLEKLLDDKSGRYRYRLTALLKLPRKKLRRCVISMRWTLRRLWILPRFNAFSRK